MDTGHVNTVSTTEEENSSEVGACASHNFETSKLIKKTTSTIESLPGDVVFDILARVPAQDIHYAARLVCHKWYQTTRTRDFVRAHLQQSTRGLVIHRTNASGSERDLFATHQKGGGVIEKSDFIYKFTRDAFSSCNGLVLEHHNNKKTGSVLRITNPATNQHMGLPFFAFAETPFYKSAIAYAVASKEYKVVCPFYSHSSEEEIECAILTVGVDEDWKRRVDIRHLSPTAKFLLFATQALSSTDGFVHWAAQYKSEYVVLTLNVETEIITQSPALPPSFSAGDETKFCYHCLTMGRCLSLLIGRIDNKPFPIWDQVWVLEPETGEWTKLMSIDSESQKRAFQGVNDHTFFPVGWLKSREVLVFTSYSSSSCTAYNVRTHEIETFEFGFAPRNFVAHQNSLVWLDMDMDASWLHIQAGKINY